MSKILTGKVRFSYVNVFTPTAMDDGQQKKYNMSVLIDKDDKETLSRINKAIEDALETKKAEWQKNGKWPKLTMPLHDGDIDKPDHEEYAGQMFLNARSSRKPGIVNKKLEPVISEDDIYSGCYGRVQLSFYPYDVRGVKGIAVGLENIQTYCEGERFGGSGESAEDAFNDGAFDGAGTEDAF